MNESRYEILIKIATGGMATIFVGRLRGKLGFEQLVALKRPHEHLRGNDDFRRALAVEARLCARIRHANVVTVRDAEIDGDSVFLVLDYIEGGSLTDLRLNEDTGADRATLAPIVVRIILDVCAGLHAAHEVRGDDDRVLELVHRDVSPQNVLVGLDGLARVTDFGIAKCLEGNHDATTDGVLKGKIAYMSPEHVAGKPLDRRADVFAIGILLWEGLVGRRLFRGANAGETIQKILGAPIVPPSSVDPAFRPFDAVVAKAMSREPAERYSTASEMAEALEAAAAPAGLLATHSRVARVVQDILGEALAQRRERVRVMMRTPADRRDPNAEAEGEATQSLVSRPPQETTGTATMEVDSPSVRTAPLARAAVLSSRPPDAAPRRTRRGAWLIAIGIVAAAAATAFVAGPLRDRPPGNSPAPERAPSPAPAPAPTPVLAPTPALPPTPPSGEPSSKTKAPIVRPKIVRPASPTPVPPPPPAASATSPPPPVGPGPNPYRDGGHSP